MFSKRKEKIVNNAPKTRLHSLKLCGNPDSNIRRYIFALKLVKYVAT